MNQNYLQIKSALAKKEELLKGSDAGFGISLLTFPGMSSSSRSVMFSSHIRQHMVLKNPDSPRMFTNYENIFGRLSSGYTEAKSNYEIVARIPKYSWLPNYMYTLILWNIDEERYEIFERKHIENLTEKYAYEYKSNIDDKYEGDKINKGDVMWQSTSYDEDMNFGYGKNMNIAYVYDTDTIEDAIKITDVAASKMCSKEAEVISIPLNDNDFLGNFYGDKNNYKVIPDIGESIRDHILCFKRRKFNNQILYDFKDSNLRKPNFSGDTPYYNDGVIEDITIYCNKELDEIDDIEFNDQLKKYLKEQNRYWTQLRDALEEVITTGKECSTDINYFYKRASQILDPDYKWKPDDKMFSNMIIEVTISRDDFAGVGSKLAGRCGNKGVVSKVIPQEESYYYYLPDGTKVYADIIVNALGVINRTNSPQLYELDLNNFADRIIEEIHFNLKTLEEKEKMFFKFYEIVNHIQGDALREYYNGLKTTERKLQFFENAYKEKLYIHVPPFWQVDDESLFYKLVNLLKEFGEDFADRDTYLFKHGREIKTLRRVSIGSEYFMKLRQNSKKAFSACSLTSINEQSLPMKSKRAKDGLELYPKAPVRFGVQETTNFLIGVPPEALAKLSHVYRSSPAARRALGMETITNTRELETFKVTEEMANVNVEILDAYLKAIGYKVEFSDKFKDNLLDLNADSVIYERVDEEDGTVFLGTDKEYFDYKVRKDIKKELIDNDFILSRVQFEEMFEELVKERKEAIMRGEIRFEL